MQTSAKLQYTVLVMALSAVCPLQATAASAGIAQFTAGDVNLRRPDGRSDPLTKGKDIESGQSIVTGSNGRAQVKFSNGRLLSLQPDTEFRITDYINNTNPKEDRFLVTLVSGSMRALTGLISKGDDDNYKVVTSAATIGIRGSGFNLGYNVDGSLGVTTVLDSIDVCNAGGCLGITAGESVLVLNNTDAPVRTNTRPLLPTPTPSPGALTAATQSLLESTDSNDVSGWGGWTTPSRTASPGATVSTLIDRDYVNSKPAPVIPTIGAAYYTTEKSIFTLALASWSALPCPSCTQGPAAGGSTVAVTSNAATGSGALAVSFSSLNTSFSQNTATGVIGFFSGSNAARAGIAYQGYSSSGNGYFNGAVVLGQP